MITHKQYETHIGEDVDVTVSFDYEPPQPTIAAPNDCAQAPFPAEVTLCRVEVYSDRNCEYHDILDDLSNDCHNRLAERCLRAVEEGLA